MRVVLIATYEMGRQPFGLASPAAWLDRAGAHVTLCDLSRQPLPEEEVRRADFIGFYVPMHTATRLAVALLPHAQELNPRAFVCFYGLYAPVNADHLRSLGVHAVLGGEFEQELTDVVVTLSSKGRGKEESHQGGHAGSSVPRLQFIQPNRAGLPLLKSYAHLVMRDGGHRVAGYTEASRGCKHLCRHCPIVPVYAGVFRIVQPEVVLADVRQQVAAGAEHITFGDPDFFNGPAHAMRIVEGLHREFPALSYDVTIKIEHLLKHADLLPRLRETGCLFVTSAAESVDDAVLQLLEKGHTRADFVRAVALVREAGLPLQPTFVPFTPWTTPECYAKLLRTLVELDLVESVAPIHLAIRLLIPAGSRLLELAELRAHLKAFDPAALCYPWKHPDGRVDKLQREVEAIVQTGEKLKRPRAKTFLKIWEATQAVTALSKTSGVALGNLSSSKTGGSRLPHSTLEQLRIELPLLASRATIPYLNEPWYC